MPASVRLADVPIGVLVLLAIITVVEVGLDVFALIDLYRRPRERVLAGNKWIWVLLILLVNLVGALVYLALARLPAPAAEPERAPDREGRRIGEIVDSLYGPPEDPARR